MGNVSGNETRDQEIHTLREKVRLLKIEMNNYQNRLTGVEKDVATLTILAKDNANSLLNISLLEEGRSVYRRPKRHAGSSYN
jgi:hypothetical protein